MIKFIWEIIHSLANKRNIDCEGNAMSDIKLNMDDGRYIAWRSKASEVEVQLWDRMADFRETMFTDMLFEPGSSSYNLIKYQSKDPESNVWVDDSAVLYDHITNFSTSWFTIKVEELTGCAAYYSKSEQQIHISTKFVDNDVILLHEMIHLFEFMINDLPLHYHDMLYWAIYQDLRKKIEGLDDAITQHAHALDSMTLYNKGGLHDILFLLKSFDLDLRQGYPFGTVFGYRRMDDFKFLKIKK